MENVAIVQPTQQLKSKEPNAHKTVQKSSNSPSRAGTSDRKFVIYC